MLTKEYIDEHQLAERYLADQLSDAEREEFENYYISNPDVLRDLEAIASIKLGAALLRQSGELQRLTKPRIAPTWRGVLALAASVLIAVAVGSYWSRSTPGPRLLAADITAFSPPLSLAATYQVQRTRSDVDATVTLPPSPQAIKLRVRPLRDPQPRRVRVELRSVADDDARTQLAVADDVGLDAGGFIALYLNSALLKPGTYELAVTANAPASTGAPASDEFLIEVAPTPR